MSIMDVCLDKLPPDTARVFMMRELMELETDEICKELTITANNLWVGVCTACMQFARQIVFMREALQRYRT